MSSSCPFPESFEDEQWDPFQNDPPSQQVTQQVNKLGFCPYQNLNREDTYDKEFIHYSIEWEVKVNRRSVLKETEQDLVLAPSEFWEHFLESKLEKVLLRKERAKSRALKPEDTKIVVIVTQQRSEPSLTKSFDETNIDWSVVETQLVAWSDLFIAGKKLRVTISFNYNYVEAGQPSTASSRNIDKRRSTTRRMLTELDAELNLEEEATGQVAIWRDVYKTMRCPGSPCNKGEHCWRDPDGKKHYSLKARHMKRLIRFVMEGGVLETQDDVPDDLRQQLYVEEQQSLSSKGQKAGTPGANLLHPIHITNTLPPSFYQTSHPRSSPVRTQVPDIIPSNPCLVIPGFRDENVDEYCAWQQSKVAKNSQKLEYQKACDVMTRDCMTLQTIYRNPDPKYLTDQGVKRGAAEHIVNDIDEWVHECKRARTEDY